MPRAPWREDDSQVRNSSASQSPAALVHAHVSAPLAPPPPAPAGSADSAPHDAHERIRAAAAKGGSLKALHTLFSVPADSVKRWLDADASLRKAYDEGVELEREALHRTLYEAAIYKRDLNAAQFLLKHRHNYVQAVAPSKSRVDVNVNARGGVMVLPAEITLEEWEKQATRTQAKLKEKARE
jgi:hypothetical protein